MDPNDMYRETKDGGVEKVDFEEGAVLFGDVKSREIGTDKCGKYNVSTKFVVFNHGTDEYGRVLLYETVVSPRDRYRPVYCERYATRAEAEAGHQRVCRWYKEKHSTDIGGEG